MPAALRDIRRNFMARMFGTDGVRGIANTELDGLLAYRLGQAGAEVLIDGAEMPTVLVGTDTRISGDMLKSALMAGICSVGAHAVDLGVITTPAIAMLTRQLGADAGVMISASHNPAKDNGIKFFNKDGYKLSDALEDKIEALVRSDCTGIPMPTGDGVGRIEARPELRRTYIDLLKQRCTCDLTGMKIVLDCANGSASVVAPELFSELGAQVIAMHAEPDGLNINASCGSTHPESLQRRVVEEGADCGLAFDGDADRLIAVDDKGRIVDGDQMLVICSRALKQKGRLAGNTCVVTVMSNMGLDIAMREAGIDVVRTAVGDRYVLERMLQDGFIIGGEASGHMIFLEDNTTGDGLMSALHILQVMAETGKPLSALADQMQRLPQVLVNVKCAGDKKHLYKENAEIMARIAQIESSLAGCGRVLVRPSGTEALVRVMVEGPDEATINACAQELAELMKEKMS